MARGIFEQLDWLTKKVKQLCCIIENGGGGGGGECKCEIIEKTKSQIDSLVSSDGLLPGRFYRISNVCPPLYGGTDIIIQAATENTFVDNAEGFFYNPKYDIIPIWNNTITCTISYTNAFTLNETIQADNGAVGIFLTYGMIRWVSGDWSGATTITGLSSGATGTISGAVSPSYNVNDRVIWGGRVWANNFGNVGTSINQYQLDPGQWSIVAYNATDYNLVVDEIKYNYENDVIYYRRDGEDNTSNIVDGFYTTAISYLGVKGFQWGNNSIVYGNRVSNSGCNIINFRGSGFTFNEILQYTLVENIVCDSTSFIDGNVITDGYMGNCYLSQSSNISYNVVLLGSIYDVSLSNTSVIQGNNVSYSSINTNLLHSSLIQDNELTQGSTIYENKLLGSIDIIDNKLSNNSSITYNILINNTAIKHNTLDNNCLIQNNFQDGALGVLNCVIEYNNFSLFSNIQNCGSVYIGYNTLSNTSTINASGPSGGTSLYIANNILDDSEFTSILVTDGIGEIANNVLMKESGFISININQNFIQYNNFFSSGFISSTMTTNSYFNNNIFQFSSVTGINNWGPGYSISSCKLNNSGIVSLIGGLYSGDIKNVTMTDVTLDRDLAAATYIFQPYSKTISLAFLGSGNVAKLSYIDASTGTLVIDDYDV